MWSCKSLPGKASLSNNASIVHREGLFLENDLQSLQYVLDAIIPLNVAKLNLLKVDWSLDIDRNHLWSNLETHTE